MAFVDSIVNMVAEVEPVWLLTSLLLGSALAVLLPTARTRLGRHRHWQRSTVAAQTAMQQGRYAEAKRMFLALLQKAEKDFGPEDPKVASALRKLVTLYQLQGQHTVAEPLLHRSLAIMEKADPAIPNIEMAAVLELLGGVYEAQGRYKATELVLHRSLAIRERALGPDHPHVANVLKQIAMFYKRNGEENEAKRLEERRSAMAGNGSSSSGHDKTAWKRNRRVHFKMVR